MTISDFLVMITIVLTLVTIAMSNNKKIWLYKFYKRDFFSSFFSCFVDTLFDGFYEYVEIGKK